jgi:DnaJ-domain-containing protein 1
VDRDQLVLGLAAVFAGTSMLLIVLGFVYQLFLLVVAVPFVAVTYVMWSHASGRLEERTRRRRVRQGPRDPSAASRGPRDFQGFGPGRRAAGAAGGETGRRRSAGGGSTSRRDPSVAEAYRTLGLEPGASDAAVKQAYRAKVKETHPDTESGDEETFKRVNRAYERLND